MKKNKQFNKKTLLVTIGLLLGVSASVMAATWQGTDWISDGSIISATKMKENFQYLYDRVTGNTTAITNLQNNPQGKFKDGANANDAVYTQGNVGIGTTTPDVKLSVTGGFLKVYNNGQTLRLGSANHGWSHIDTTAPRFYFNKAITVDSGEISSYNNQDLQLQVSGNTRVKINDGGIMLGNKNTGKGFILHDRLGNDNDFFQISPLNNGWTPDWSQRLTFYRNGNVEASGDICSVKDGKKVCVKEKPFFSGRLWGHNAHPWDRLAGLQHLSIINRRNIGYNTAGAETIKLDVPGYYLVTADLTCTGISGNTTFRMRGWDPDHGEITRSQVSTSQTGTVTYHISTIVKSQYGNDSIWFDGIGGGASNCNSSHNGGKGYNDVAVAYIGGL